MQEISDLYKNHALEFNMAPKQIPTDVGQKKILKILVCKAEGSLYVPSL